MRKFLVGLGALALTVALAGPAGAHTDKSARLKLITERSGAEIGWSRGPDSPLDANRGALNIRTDAGEYAYAYNPTWLGEPKHGSRAIQKIRNLSFDVLNEAGGGYVGAGAPRLSIIFLDGSVAYLSAEYCQLPISGSTNWSRADFTGATTADGPCAFYYDGEPAPYANTATESAWEVFVAAHPELRVDYGFLIVDETTAPGRARVDRIAMQNHMQISGGKVVHCPNESSC